MGVQVGNVIEKEDGLHVITEITNGVISRTEKLEDYIMRVTFIHEYGEYRTIKEIIEKRCEMYLKSGIKIIKV